MALSAKVVSFLLTDAVVGTTQAITGVGFVPKAIIFFWGGSLSAVDEAVSADTRFGVGFTVSTSNRRTVGCWIGDNLGTMDTGTSARTDCSIVTRDATAVDGRWDLQSLDADGFTLIVDQDAPLASAVRVHALCLGGTDITNVTGGSFSGPDLVVDQDVTGLGFQPDIVFFAAPQESAGQAHRMFGVGRTNTQQGVLLGASLDAAANSDTDSYCNNNDCIVTLDNTAIKGRASFVQTLADGFRINWSLAAAPTIQYLAIKGGSWFVGDLLTATSLTTIVESGFGFQPVGVLVASHAAAESTPGTLQSHMNMSIGAADSPTSRGAHGNNEQDNLATSDVWLGIEYDEVYQNLSGGAGVVGLMDIQSFDADGITFVMDDADPTANFAWYVACGDAAAGPPGPNALMMLGVGQ